MAYIVRTMSEIDALRDKVQPIVNGNEDVSPKEMAVAGAIWDTLVWFTEHGAADPFEIHIGED